MYLFFTLYIHHDPSESVILDHSIDNMIHFSLNTPILVTQWFCSFSSLNSSFLPNVEISITNTRQESNIVTQIFCPKKLILTKKKKKIQQVGLDGKFHLGELNIGFANLQIAFFFVISTGTPVYMYLIQRVWKLSAW